MDNAQYWASVPTDELAARVREQVDAYYQGLRSDGRMALWKRAYQHYYGLDDRGRHVSAFPASDGKQGEFLKVKAAHARNLAQHLINLTVQSRASFEGRSLNTDYEAQSSCILGQQVLDWYMREKQLERLFRTAVEYSVFQSEAFMVYDWDRDRGDAYAVDPATGRVIKGGDVDCRVFLPSDMIREFYQDEDGRADWHIAKRKVSRFKLAAQYPDQGDEILALPAEVSSVDMDDVYSGVPQGSDRVTVYYLYHDRVPQLQTGRRSVIVGDLVLEDEAFPFKKYNVHRICPGEQAKTPYGYTSFFDLMGLNDVIDMIYSANVSNVRTFAIQNVWTKPGAGLKVSDLAGGLRHMQSTEKPEAIQLTASSPESYNLIKILETLCETLSGVNSVARGNPEGALKGSSGSAMALLQSMTIQFASGLQQSYAQLVEQGGDTIIAILQTHAQVERVAAIVGKHNKSYAKPFTGKDLDPISKVVVDMGNPATRTAAGRVQIADNLLQQGLLKSSDEYLNVLSTGRLEPLTEGKQAQLLLVKAENEDLKEGRPVQAIITDKHALHIEEHAAILADPETRRQGNIVQGVLAHIQEHIDQARNLPPDLAMLTGQEPLPQVMPGGPGAPPPGAGGPPPGPGGPGEQAPGPTPEAGEMPRLPTNPLSGEQAEGAA